jgi:hypothetical protein
MLEPLRHAFHPDRGIGQGDTPSTLIFIAVFDILLTLVDSSRTGEAHAYADDLVHIAPSLDQQQRQVDLVCGFCAYTGLEISLVNVEAISINYGNNILYDTPYLTLHDWHWNSHTVQHHDDGYWTRYLGLFLDQHACSQHFHRAKLKLKMICRLLARKIVPPSAKRLVYSLCIKSQIRYAAGLAPWTIAQYQKLEKNPAALLRQIYGLRRTFPSDLIYASEDVGGCGESHISDAATLQKWTYLHSLAHDGHPSANVVTSLLQRALTASITDQPVYCTSLVDWGRRMGLTLHQASPAPIPPALSQFIAATFTATSPPVYSNNGSFTVDPPLLVMLTRLPADLVTKHAVAVSGVYLPPAHGLPGAALRITTRTSSASNAYY